MQNTSGRLPLSDIFFEFFELAYLVKLNSKNINMIFYDIFQAIIPHFHILLVVYHDGFVSINKLSPFD